MGFIHIVAIAFLAIILLIIVGGLINPKWFKDPKNEKVMTRKEILFGGIGLVTVLAIIIAFTTPDQSKDTLQANQPDQPVNVDVKNDVVTVSPITGESANQAKKTMGGLGITADEFRKNYNQLSDEMDTPNLPRMAEFRLKKFADGTDGFSVNFPHNFEVVGVINSDGSLQNVGCITSFDEIQDAAQVKMFGGFCMIMGRAVDNNRQDDKRDIALGSSLMEMDESDHSMGATTYKNSKFTSFIHDGSVFIMTNPNVSK